MPNSREELKIQAMAHRIWEAEGCPEGRERHYRQLAEEQVGMAAEDEREGAHFAIAGGDGVDKALADSFPASDPVAPTVRAGSPRRKSEHRPKGSASPPPRQSYFEMEDVRGIAREPRPPGAPDPEEENRRLGSSRGDEPGRLYPGRAKPPSRADALEPAPPPVEPDLKP